MNKAFVRDPDVVEEYCPRCGALGENVGGETLDSLLSEPLRVRFAGRASFCPSWRCEVLYFDSLEHQVLVSEVPTPLYPKDSAAPICPCFGFTCEEIEQDVREGGVTRTRAHVERVKQTETPCALRAANGRSCIAYVQRYYLQARQAAAGDR